MRNILKELSRYLPGASLVVIDDPMRACTVIRCAYRGTRFETTLDDLEWFRAYDTDVLLRDLANRLLIRMHDVDRQHMLQTARVDFLGSVLDESPRRLVDHEAPPAPEPKPKPVVAVALDRRRRRFREV